MQLLHPASVANDIDEDDDEEDKDDKVHDEDDEPEKEEEKTNFLSNDGGEVVSIEHDEACPNFLMMHSIIAKEPHF